jgi:ELWxxDGT repeat protein
LHYKSISQITFCFQVTFLKERIMNLTRQKPISGFLYVLIFVTLFSTVCAAAIPVLVKDINEGYGEDHSYPHKITDVNGIAFLLAKSGDAYGDDEYALWRSDGTEAGTRFIKDLDIPERHGTYGEFTAFGNELFFRGIADTGGGYELWKSDGTAYGTQMVRDIYPGDDSSFPEFLTAYDIDNDPDNHNDMLLFLANTEEYGKELWRSDGTELGTYMIKDIREGTSSSVNLNAYCDYDYAVSDNIFYFSATANSYSVGEKLIAGCELWRSNGTENGTYMVVDLTPYNNIPYGPGTTRPYHFNDLDGTLIFTGGMHSIGTELLRSDGTANGTVLVKDINPEGSSYPSHFVKVERHFVEVGGHLVEVESRLYFLADDGVHGRELWVTNGTASGTHMVIDLVPGEAGVWTKPSWGESNRDNPVLEQMTAFDDRLFFRFNDGKYNHGFELWVSNGSAIGTHLFKDIGTGDDQFGYAASGYPDELTVVGGKMFFSAWDPVHYRELWETDGTVARTKMVADMSIYPAWIPRSYSNPTQLTNVNGDLFFSSRNDHYLNYLEMGYELWKVMVAAEELQISFIERFYRNILGRSADDGGLAYWKQIIQNNSAARIALGFFNSAEFTGKNLNNRDFLNIVYQTLFDRAADAAGFNYWLVQLNSNALRRMVIYGFLRSQEFKALSQRFGVTAFSANDEAAYQVARFVLRFYTLVLNRQPDVNGFDYWNTFLNNGTKAGGDIAIGFFRSKEFTDRNTTNSQFVDICYQAFFARAADGGKQFWLNKLNTGEKKRLDVINGFIDSKEFINLAGRFGIRAR